MTLIATRCPRCHSPVLTGPDDTTAAITVTCETQALDNAAEVTALLTGRPTYTLITILGRTLITRRDHWTIAAHPADTVTAVTRHTCGQPLGTRTINQQPQPETQTGEDAPF